MPDPNIVEGVRAYGSIAAAASTTRATQSTVFAFDWILLSAHVSLVASQGPCLAHVEINPAGVTGQTTALKSQWIRGSSVTGGSGELAWFGRIPLKQKSSLFAFVRNDTDSAVTPALLWTGERFPPVVR